MMNAKYSRQVRYSDIRGIDRAGIWAFLWGMREAGANTAAVRAVVRRWEKITGGKYYG